ncbi:hypothetical protein [Streptomyces microflavus]|uniref:hypothetical protein n=1 Tax=Streptomyces microflavus TaxID=1919 RepID=UPI0036CE3A73
MSCCRAPWPELEGIARIAVGESRARVYVRELDAASPLLVLCLRGAPGAVRVEGPLFPVAEPLAARARAAALRVAAEHRAADRCTVPWGVCPEHGATLKSTGGRAWCTNLACLNTWTYDRLDPACTEPATHTIQVDNGDRYVVCDGHALTARTQITDRQVLPGLPA